jgi:hypothetical protein
LVVSISGVVVTAAAEKQRQSAASEVIKSFTFLLLLNDWIADGKTLQGVGSYEASTEMFRLVQLITTPVLQVPFTSPGLTLALGNYVWNLRM